jgi:hypothetical protein
MQGPGEIPPDSVRTPSVIYSRKILEFHREIIDIEENTGTNATRFCQNSLRLLSAIVANVWQNYSILTLVLRNLGAERNGSETCLKGHTMR